MSKRLSKKEQAQVDVAKLLINGGYDLSLVDTAWNTPLHVARDRETTELLLKKKPSFLNSPNLSGRTPLFGAGSVKTTLLLEAGANPNRPIRT